MSYRGFTYPLKPAPEQESVMAQTAGVCRLVWNLALEQRRDHWRRYRAVTGSTLNFVAQCRELTELRKEVEFVNAVSQNAAIYALRSLDRAYLQALRGEAGFPGFRKRGVHESFTFYGREVRVEKINTRWAQVKLPKIGWVRARMHRAVVGDIAEATVSRTAKGWQVSLLCKTDAAVADVGGAVGIDRGVANPLMLSDGTRFALPTRVSKIGEQIRKAQHDASRGLRGSKRNALAKRRVATLRAMQARVRKHWAHETTTAIARQYGTVVIESLSTKSMTKSAAGSIEEPGVNVAQKRGLNRVILNVGWRQIETMLSYKAYRLIKVDARYTSQTCSACGTVDKGSRKNQASFVCTACGYRGNADLNAAVNILRRGSSPVVEAGTSQSMKRKPAGRKAGDPDPGQVDASRNTKGRNQKPQEPRP